MTDGVARVVELRRSRNVRSLRVLAYWLVVTQVMFLAFALGASRGPAPLRKMELMLGSVSALLIGMIAGAFSLRGAIESDSRYRAMVRDGPRKRRVVLFEDYFTLDAEIVLYRELRKVQRSSDLLLLHYRDVIVDGPVIRELSGESGVLEALHRKLSRAREATGSEEAVLASPPAA